MTVPEPMEEPRGEGNASPYEIGSWPVDDDDYDEANCQTCLGEGYEECEDTNSSGGAGGGLQRLRPSVPELPWKRASEGSVVLVSELSAVERIARFLAARRGISFDDCDDAEQAEWMWEAEATISEVRHV